MAMYFEWRFYAGDISKQLCYGATHDANVKYFREQPGGHNEFEAEKN